MAVGHSYSSTLAMYLKVLMLASVLHLAPYLSLPVTWTSFHFGIRYGVEAFVCLHISVYSASLPFNMYTTLSSDVYYLSAILRRGREGKGSMKG